MSEINQETAAVKAEAAETETVKAEVKTEAKPETPAVPEEAKLDEAVKSTEETAEEAAAKAADELKEAEETVDQMEKESLQKLEIMREKDNAENEKIVADAEKKIREIYDDLRSWIKTNSTPEKIKENLETARKQTAAILSATREKVMDIADSEDFKKAMGGIKDFIDGTGSLIAEGFTYGKEQLSKNPAFKELFDSVDNGIDKLRDSQVLHNTVEKAQEITNNLTNGLFSGLKSFFEGGKASAPAPAKPAEEKPEVKPEVKPAEEAKPEEEKEDKGE